MAMTILHNYITKDGNVLQLLLTQKRLLARLPKQTKQWTPVSNHVLKAHFSPQHLERIEAELEKSYRQLSASETRDEPETPSVDFHNDRA